MSEYAADLQTNQKPSRAGKGSKSEPKQSKPQPLKQPILARIVKTEPDPNDSRKSRVTFGKGSEQGIQQGMPGYIPDLRGHFTIDSVEADISRATVDWPYGDVRNKGTAMLGVKKPR